jgi:uncharacterized protein (DUF2147 family)
MTEMRTLCIAATCVLLAAPAAHAGSIIDSFMGGASGFSIGDCNTDHCSFSMGKQKHVVRRSDFGSAAATGRELGEKAMGAAKSQLNARAKGSDTSVSERTAPSKPRESVVDRSDDRPAPRRDETVGMAPRDTAKDAPVKDTVAAPAKDPVFTKDTFTTKDPVVPAEEKVAPIAAVPAAAAAEPAASYDAKSPIGEWITEDGEGRVRIRACGQALCGVISSGDPKETDRHNPDVNKRNRPLLGTPVLIDMKSVNSKRWEGEIYNAKNGKTYASNIMLKNPDVLRVEGCVFGGFFCGGQDWVRAKDGTKG